MTLNHNACSRTPESRLYWAVLLQAFTDAIYTACNDSEVEEARKWLTTPSAGFTFVCNACDQDPNRVRALALKLIASPPKDRRHRNIDRKSGKRAKRYTFKGQTLTLSEWSNAIGVARQTLVSRLHKGWPIERALTYRRGHTDHERGVVADFKAPLGTGVGSIARDDAKLEFFK